MENGNNKVKNDNERVGEINLIDVFWMWLAKYKTIIICMLVFAILLGAYSLRGSLRRLRAERAESAAADELTASEEYERKASQYRQAIQDLEDTIALMEDYGKNAVILRVDPNNVYKSEMVYYVDNHYQIVTDSYYQDPNNITSILEYYYSIITRVDANAVIATAEEPDLTTKNLVPNATVSLERAVINYSYHFITITIYADTREHADMIADAYAKAVTDSYRTVCDVAGDHEIKQILSEKTVVTESAFAANKLNYNDYMESLYADLEAKEAELEALKAPAVASSVNIVKSLVKYGIVGLVLGAVVSLVLVILKIFMGDQLISTEDLRRRYRLPALGTLSSKSKKGLFGKLDRKILKQLGIPESDPEAARKLALTNIQVRAGQDEVTLVSVDDGLLTEELQQVFTSDVEGKNVTICGNPSRSAEAVVELKNGKPVVLAAELMKTSHKDIFNVVKLCEGFGNPVLGFIVLTK